jgi:hypothetical protein
MMTCLRLTVLIDGAASVLIGSAGSAGFDAALVVTRISL